MPIDDLEHMIRAAWEKRAEISPEDAQTQDGVMRVMAMLDSGAIRVAQPGDDGAWVVNEWVKQAILLYFRLQPNQIVAGGPGNSAWWDKVPLKFTDWGADEFRGHGFRAVPGAAVRYASFIARDVVLMPSFVNIGAYIGEGTMIDTWATIGSCAQIGAHCHISGGVGIGGVLEPLQAAPVIIEDNVFIGARSEIAEGVRVCEGAVISMGCFIGASTKIIDRETGEMHQGTIPPYSVVIPGTLPGRALPNGGPGPHLACAVIVKTVDAKTRAKTAINELLRA